MVESYTAEDLLKLRKCWLDKVEELQGCKTQGADVPLFSILTSRNFILTVFNNGKVTVVHKDLWGSWIDEYVKLYPRLESSRSWSSFFLIINAELKKHLISLIRNPTSEIIGLE